MDPTQRFVDATERALRGEAPSLDVWAAMIGQAFDRHAGTNTVAMVTEILDALADRCEPTFAGVLDRLFARPDALLGNAADYSDQRNSYLHSVLIRRVGIPITLSVVAIEVGRRVGVPIGGLGLPGHFMITDGEQFADPFRGADRFDAQELELQWRRNTGLRGRLDAHALTPLSNRAIVLRMLNNLKRTFVAIDDPMALYRLARMRGAFPELATEAAEHARWMRAWN